MTPLGGQVKGVLVVMKRVYEMIMRGMGRGGGGGVGGGREEGEVNA